MSDEFSGLKAWMPSLKRGLVAFVIFLFACFAYGWVNDFTFWHAHADAGMNSAIAHTIYYGVFAGPFVLAVVALIHQFFIKK